MSSDGMKRTKPLMREEDKIKRAMFYINLACDIQLAVLFSCITMWLYAIISHDTTFIMATTFIVLVTVSIGVGINSFKLLRNKRL